MNTVRIRSNRRSKYRQYLTTWNRMNHVRKMSEGKCNLLAEIDLWATKALAQKGQ